MKIEVLKHLVKESPKLQEILDTYRKKCYDTLGDVEENPRDQAAFEELVLEALNAEAQSSIEMQKILRGILEERNKERQKRKLSPTLMVGNDGKMAERTQIFSGEKEDGTLNR